MKRDILNLNFISTLNKKIPNKAQLANLLTDILNIEKEAIYRRLRGDVSFSFAEVAIIAENLGISLDNLVGLDYEKRRPFSLQLTDFIKPLDSDYNMWENYNNILKIFSKGEDFYIGKTWTTLPFPLCYKYPHLYKFFVFKWGFQHQNASPAVPYSQIKLNDNLIKLSIDNYHEEIKAKTTEYIFSDEIFQNLVKDLKLFHNIRLLSNEELIDIQKDMSDLLRYLEQVSIQGKFPETGKEVHLYISDIDIDTNYSLIESSGNYICMLRTLVLNSAATTDETTYICMKKWFTAIKRLSRHISISGEKERIIFFKQQREIIDSLLE